MSLIPISISTQFTSVEATFLAGFADLTHSQGDVFYINSSGQVARLTAGTNGNVLTTGGPGANPSWTGAGAGSVTTVSVVSTNGFAGTVANASTTPAITLTTTVTGTLQGNGTAISASKVTLTQPATGSTLTIIDGKTLTVDKTMEFTAADDTGVYTFPTGIKTLVATDVATLSSLTSVGTISTGTWSATTIAVNKGGTGGTVASITLFNNITGFSAAGTTGTTSTNLVFSTSPTFITPVLGAASATSLATSAASPLLLTNGQLVTVALTSQTVGGTTLTIPDFASVVDEFTFKTKSQTMSNKTFVTPVLGAATATSINGLTITSSTGTFTLTNAKTLSVSDTTTLATNSITLGGGEVVTFSASNALSLLSSGTTVMTFPAATDTVAVLGTAQTYTATQTEKQVVWTNNAITASSNAATVPITSRLNTVTNNSAATLTITMTTTSAVDGQLCFVRILDSSAAAQTITWVNTENSTATVPTTSNGSTTLYKSVGFQFNGSTSLWRCIASA